MPEPSDSKQIIISTKQEFRPNTSHNKREVHEHGLSSAVSKTIGKPEKHTVLDTWWAELG